MKIGILTYHHANNYGAVIQCYALMSQLRNMGHCPIIIDMYRKPSVFFSFLGKIKRFMMGKQIDLDPGWRLFRDEVNIILTPKTDYLSSSNKALHYDFSSFGAVIVGSDQIWRDSEKSIGEAFYFDFITDERIRKISYAASFGYDSWVDSDYRKKKIAKLLKEFSFISVREISGQKICKEIFNIESEVVLDPTMLLQIEDYAPLLINTKIDENFVVSYFLGNDRKENVDSLRTWCIQNKMLYRDLYSLGMYDDECNEKEHATLKEWISAIKNAKYIVTNSFHACVFCIIFHKQFMVIDHPSGGSTRIHHLLDLFSLNTRFINNCYDLDIEKLKQEIDYKKVDCIRENKIKESNIFLSNALNS